MPGLLWAGKIASGGGSDTKYACEGVTCSGSVSDTSLYTIIISGVGTEIYQGGFRHQLGGASGT